MLRETIFQDIQPSYHLSHLPFEMISPTKATGQPEQYPLRYVHLDSLPTELLLEIAGLLSRTDASCLCLTTKRCLSILGPEYIAPMRNHIYKKLFLSHFVGSRQ